MNEVIKEYFKKYGDKFIGEAEGKFPVFIYDSSSSWEYTRAGIIGERAIFFDLGSKYLILVKGKTFWSGNDNLYWRIKKLEEQKV